MSDEALDRFAPAGMIETATSMVYDDYRGGRGVVMPLLSTVRFTAQLPRLQG